MNKDEMSMTADWLQEGIAQAKVGEKDEAGRLLQVAAEMSPNNEVVWLWLAVVSETKSDKIEYLTKALTINPNNQRTAKMLGQLKGEQVKTASWRCPMCLTVAEGRQMVCSTCASVLSLTDLGGLLEAKVDRDLVKPAITRYQNMLGKGVDFGVHYNLTLAFLNLGELDAGISHLQQADHLKPLNKGLQHQHDLLVAHQTAMQAVALVDEPDYEAMGMVTTTSPGGRCCGGKLRASPSISGHNCGSGM